MIKKKQQIRNPGSLFFYCNVMLTKAVEIQEIDGGPLNPKEIGSEKTVEEIIVAA